MKSLSSLSLAGLLSLALSTAVQAAPAKIWTTWQATNMSQSQCMRRATSAISDLGYDYQVLESGVYGEYGDISVTIRCTTEMGFIFFIATHPDTDVASQELNALIDAF
jgi:hypothetical protein